MHCFVKIILAMEEVRGSTDLYPIVGGGKKLKLSTT